MTENENPTVFETAHLFAYVFARDWRAGVVALLQVANAAEHISPGCLTGSNHIDR